MAASLSESIPQLSRYAQVKRALNEHLKLAIPNILSNLTVPLAGLVDTVLLGHESTAGPLAGVALAGAIFSFLYWGLIFLRMSTTGLTANAVGAGDEEETVGLFLRSFCLALVLGISILLLSPLIEVVSFYLLQGEPAVEAQGLRYYRARIWGAPAVLGLMAINGWLLGRLKSRQVLLLSIIQNTLIVVLDLVFIKLFGWGAAGAGYATALSDGLSFLAGLMIVRWTWGELPSPKFSILNRLERLKELFALNGQLLIRSFFLILTLTSFTNISAWMGEGVLGANGILLQLLLFCAYFVDGFAFALESLAGVAAGLKDWIQVRLQLKLTLALSFGTTVVFATLFWLFMNPILQGMTIHQELHKLALSVLPHFLLVLVVANFAYVYDGFFTGLTLGKEMRNSVILGSLMGFLPLAGLAIRYQSPGLLWLAYGGFAGLRSAYLAYRSKRFLRQHLEP